MVVSLVVTGGQRPATDDTVPAHSEYQGSPGVRLRYYVLFKFDDRDLSA